MNGDPKIWRVVGCCLITLGIVCLAGMRRLPMVICLPMLLFFGWRWWVRRKLDQPGTKLITVQEPDVIDVEYEVKR